MAAPCPSDPHRVACIDETAEGASGREFPRGFVVRTDVHTGIPAGFERLLVTATAHTPPPRQLPEREIAVVYQAGGW